MPSRFLYNEAIKLKTSNITISEVINRYECLFFDVYGVLLDKRGLYGHTLPLFTKLRKLSKPFLLVSNGASKTLDETVSYYNKLGLQVNSSEVITSGSLLKDWVIQNNLTGAKAFILGDEPSKNIVKESGMDLVTQVDFEVFLVMNQTENLLPVLDQAITALISKIDSGSPFKMLLPNPDHLYPKSNSQFGITSGALANLIEGVLRKRYGKDMNYRFECLGKPYSPIFKKATEMVGTKNVAMIGDQYPTDIEGALNFGVDGVLYTKGMTKISSFQDFSVKDKAFYLLNSFEPF